MVRKMPEVLTREGILRISKSSKNFLFNSQEAKYLWNRSDDAIRTTRLLSEIYSDVPKKLDVAVHVLEFHKLVCKSNSEKKKILEWLDRGLKIK